MYIVDQDRSNVVNIGNVKSIALSGKRITADDYTLAAYDTEQRGKEVFEQLLGNAFPPDMIVAKNCNISEDAVNDLAMDHMRRLKRLMKNFKDGTITEEFFDKSFTSRIGSIKHADTYNLVQKITCEAKELKESHA